MHAKKGANIGHTKPGDHIMSPVSGGCIASLFETLHDLYPNQLRKA